MPKFTCRCGYIMNLSVENVNCELALIPEVYIEKIAEKLEDPIPLTIEAFYNLIDEVKTTVYQCSSCNRIHVDSSEGLFKSYVLEK